MYPFYLFPAVGLSAQTLSATTSSNVSFSAFPAAQFVELTVTGQNAYVTFDGTTPSAVNGLVLVANTPAVVWPIDKALAAAFRGASNTAVIYGTPMVTYATRLETRSLSAELQTLSSYPVNPGF
jgi:hypothetical protein